MKARTPFDETGYGLTLIFLGLNAIVIAFWNAKIRLVPHLDERALSMGKMPVRGRQRS
jgi:hypothetical protein